MIVQRFIILGCAMSLLTAAAFADGNLQLSGIMQGSRPTAIVNDTIVAAGDFIEGYLVVEVGPDYVVFQNDQEKVVRRLKEEDKTNVKKGTASATGATPPKAPVVNAPADQRPAAATPERAGKRLDQSMEYLRQADDLLRAQIKFDALYVKAVSLCEEAAREAQAAIKLAPDEISRKSMQQHLAKIQKVQAAVVREKENLNTRVRTAIVNQQVFAGMTPQNVISSWGEPLSKTNVGKMERWAYKDANGYQRNLSFSNGVLVSF
jgi:hypothetical protein